MKQGKTGQKHNETEFKYIEKAKDMKMEMYNVYGQSPEAPGASQELTSQRWTFSRIRFLKLTVESVCSWRISRRAV